MPPPIEALVNQPLFLVILGVGTLLSGLLCKPVARQAGEPWVVIFGLGVSLSLVFAATLSPAPGAISGPCLTEVTEPVTRWGLLHNLDSGRVLNTWMLIPMGVFVGYLAVRRWWLLLIAFAVPFLVEGVQRFLPVLARRCQFQDIVDNTWGLVIGAAIGVVLGYVMPRLWRLLSRTQ